MRSILLASILFFALSNLQAQLALLTDSPSYTSCVQEGVKVKFTLTNDTTRRIYFWWDNRLITTDPRNDWRFTIRNLLRNKIAVDQSDLEFRYPRYIIESIRGNPFWLPINPREKHNLGSSNFGDIINKGKPGEYSFDIGFSYNWGDTLEFMPKGSPDFSWGECDTTWTTIRINFRECSNSILLSQAISTWNMWLANPSQYSLLDKVAKSQYFALKDSTLALFERGKNDICSSASTSAISALSKIKQRSLSKTQTAYLIEAFSNFDFNEECGDRTKQSLQTLRINMFSCIMRNSSLVNTTSLLKFKDDPAYQIRQSVLYIAISNKVDSIVQFLKNDTNSSINRQAESYLERKKLAARKKRRQDWWHGWFGTKN